MSGSYDGRHELIGIPIIIHSAQTYCYATFTKTIGAIALLFVFRLVVRVSDPHPVVRSFVSKAGLRSPTVIMVKHTDCEIDFDETQ